MNTKVFQKRRAEVAVGMIVEANITVQPLGESKNSLSNDLQYVPDQPGWRE